LLSDNSVARLMWARDYEDDAPGDAMPGVLEARSTDRDHTINSLRDIGEFDWTSTPTTKLYLSGNQLTSIESGVFSELTNLGSLVLNGNQLSNLESGAFSGLANLRWLGLSHNTAITELDLANADLSSLTYFDVEGNANISSVSLRNTAVSQVALATLLDGGEDWTIGIGELDDIAHMDLSGIDFASITDLAPLYVMDDLTDLWLVDTQNLDATDLSPR
jgi:hypothetical protein